jgi:hypothetical protein
MTPIAAAAVDVTDEGAFYQHALESGWSDGLPVVATTAGRVTAMLAGTSLSPDTVIGRIAPRYADATVESIAINAVMAGCSPEHLPVLIAAVRAVCDQVFNLYAVQATTHSCGTMLILSGPYADKIGVQSGAGCLGPGFRANMTIGRALRLILRNVGGALPGVTDMSTLGSPGKVAFCFAENETASPWRPLREDLGFSPEDTTVTVVATEGPHQINDHVSDDAAGVLATITDTLATIGVNNAYSRGYDYFVALGPEHAAILAREGMTKDDVRQYIFERARIPYERWCRGGMFGMLPQPSYLSHADRWTQVPLSLTADDVRILVAGGPGRFSAWMPTHCAGRSATMRVELP